MAVGSLGSSLGVYSALRSLLLQPLKTALYTAVGQHLHQLGADDLLAKFLLLQELEVLQRRSGVGEKLEVRRFVPVLEVGEVGDERGLREQLLGGEVVEVEGVR